MKRPGFRLVHRRPGLAGGALLALASATAAVGQPNQPPRLQPVDPGLADVGPLRTSMRLVPVDLRLPSGFDQVYRVPGASSGVPAWVGGAGGSTDDRFARVSGALSAVFPRSQYAASRRGLEVLVPPDTVFYIGRLPESPAKQAPTPVPPGPLSVSTAASTGASTAVPTQSFDSPARHAGPVDLRVRNTGDQGAVEKAEPSRLRPDAPPPAPGVLTDESYRRIRVRALLMAAAAD